MDENRPINIKKKKTEEPMLIAVQPDMAKLVSIDEVPRGKKCNCICPACGTELVARKGDVRIHHFAHDSVNDCFYGVEIAIYIELSKILKREKRFYLPDAVLQFPSERKDEIVANGNEVDVDEVTFEKTVEYYPPELFCSVRNKRFRILLNFDQYYDAQDYAAFRTRGKQQNYAVLAIDVDEMMTATDIAKVQNMIHTPNNKSWVYNALLEQYQEKYKAAAVIPKMFRGMFLCPMQKRKYQNVYVAERTDCAVCSYCYDSGLLPGTGFCLAQQYYSTYKDFEKDISSRREDFFRRNGLQPAKSIGEYACPGCGVPMKRRVNRKNHEVFAGCSNYPTCKRTYRVEQNTEQIILDDRN